MVFEYIRYARLAVGLIPFWIADVGLWIALQGVTVRSSTSTNAECSTGNGMKPSATGCEGRLRGLYRIMYATTISPTTGPVYRMNFSKTMRPTARLA